LELPAAPCQDAFENELGHFRETHMPSTINLQLIGVWFCVGFFTGAGWAIAAWLVGRIFTHI